MRLNDAMVALSDETTALDILTGCQVYFDKVEEISGLFANDVVNTPEECRKVLSEATSVYMALAPLLALAETEKKNREVIYYVGKKMSVENAGEKFVATSTSTEASHHVTTYRRVRNILEGYVDAVKSAISTCQSTLKSMSDETRMLASATTS